ncbi:MAG: type II toxin-antitoxin system RelE/ParE family toxin [Planctomycetales bacterium]|nr:type II toxin-antitoxin system RelE/ParE family toxin [Planctomycetales bacterium]
MSTRKSRLFVTEKALRDISEIERYSVSEWGRKVASAYLSDIESALVRISENCELLRAESDLHPDLRFYRVNKHLLVCDVQAKSIFLLTVIHASRDIPSRLAEMQPTLAAEVELLRKQLGKRKR